MQTAIKTALLPEVDEDGLLLDPIQWDKTMAEGLAHMMGIDKLSYEHWLVIHSLRHYFNEFGVAPAMITVCHHHHKDGLWIHNLFGTCLNAWRVAGLPDPGEEAKSYLSDM